MRVIIILFLLLASAIAVNAQDVFQNHELRELRVLQINGEIAVMQADTGRYESVVVGDTIGKAGYKVIEVQKTAIIVESGATRIRIPLLHGFVR